MKTVQRMMVLFSVLLLNILNARASEDLGELLRQQLETRIHSNATSPDKDFVIRLSAAEEEGRLRPLFRRPADEAVWPAEKLAAANATLKEISRNTPYDCYLVQAAVYKMTGVTDQVSDLSYSQLQQQVKSRAETQEANAQYREQLRNNLQYFYTKLKTTYGKLGTGDRKIFVYFAITYYVADRIPGRMLHSIGLNTEELPAELGQRVRTASTDVFNSLGTSADRFAALDQNLRSIYQILKEPQTAQPPVIASQEHCRTELTALTGYLQSHTETLNYLKLMAAESSNQTGLTAGNGRQYHVGGYEDDQVRIKYYSDAWPASVDRLFSVELKQASSPAVVPGNFWIYYDPNLMALEGSMENFSVVLADGKSVPDLGSSEYCRTSLNSFERGVPAGVRLADVMSMAVFAGGSAIAGAEVLGGRCVSAAVLDVAFQLGLLATIEQYHGRPVNFKSLLKDVSLPSAASACATSLVDQCGKPCTALSGLAVGMSDDILKQIRQGKKLSEVDLDESLLQGLVQSVAMVGTEKVLELAVSRVSKKIAPKELQEALEDAGKKEGQGSEALVREVGSLRKIRDFIPSSGTQLVGKSNKTTTILGRWEPDMRLIKEKMLPNEFNVGTRFGSLSRNDGGFNFLNIPDNLANKASDFFNQYNKPWLQKAIERGDDIILATRPVNKADFIDPLTGRLVGMYAEELRFIVQRDYKPINLSIIEWNTVKGWFL